MPQTISSELVSREQVDDFARQVQALRASLHEVVIGQAATVDRLLICCLTGSHALLVGVPAWPRR